MSEKENQIFTDYLGDPVSMCKRIAELEAENERLREAAQDFVDKVECGQGFSRSKVSTANSYAKFKKALEDSDELAD